VPEYHFRPTTEFGWFLAVTAIVFLLQAFVSFDPAKITDWHAWAVALGAGLVRAVAGGGLYYITRRVVAPAE
jgi:hypothetical protein